MFFHDDEAVDKFLFERDWPAFPHLSKLLKCVQFGGAVKIDLWRVLVLYEYGGIFTDIDNTPNHLLNETTTEPTDEAFFLSDGGMRASHRFQVMAPKHPIAYLNMMEIHVDERKLLILR